MGKKNLFVFENTYTLNNFILQRWYKLADRAIGTRKPFAVALSGQKSLIPFMSRIGAIIDFDYWPHTHLFQSDDCFTQKNINGFYKDVIQQHLLTTISIEGHQFHGFSREDVDIFFRAKAYEAELLMFFRLKLGQVPVFDLVLLGMDQSGHISSWHPDILRLSHQGRFLNSFSSRHFQSATIALSPAVINQARTVIVVSTGPLDAAVVKGLIGQNEEAGHLNFLNSAKGHVYYLFDRQSAPRPSFLADFQPYDESLSYSGF
ncbi:MAG: 6-phosphogluconolactonase [Candidatus Omnitrophica bacterium]|nr:6-phosphogluconolactonase [Candidatus Omnitrophota bacterium]